MTKLAQRLVVEAFVKAPTQCDSFAFPSSPFYNTASMASSLAERWMSQGSVSPRIGSSNWLVTSSKVTGISLQERKKVWVELHHRWTKWRRLNKSRELDIHQEETMAFNTPAHYNVPMKPVSESSLSTHSFKPSDVPDLNSKRMGMGSTSP